MPIVIKSSAKEDKLRRALQRFGAFSLQASSSKQQATKMIE